MIDTIKIYSKINSEVYDKIKLLSNVKCMYNDYKRHIFYEIVNESLEGSYSSSLSVRLADGAKYNFSDSNVVEIEGSYHKLVQGHNSFDGFYDIVRVVKGLINIVENAYSIVLPSIENWYLQRIDITKSYDLFEQQKVMNYINNFRLLEFPRRKSQFFRDETVYFAGQTTTVKIYNKLREFIKHDKSKVKNYDNFDISYFEDKIKGFVRFEVEIKKKKLKDVFGDKLIKIVDVKYEDFDKIWVEEMNKILKFDCTKLDKVRKKDEVLRRLNLMYKSTKASVLYAFYLQMIVDGSTKVKEFTSKSSYYRKIEGLVSAGIDYTQCDVEIIENVDFVDFDPFTSCEVV